MQLKAEKREIFGKSLLKNKANEKLPAVLYGPKENNIPLFVSLPDFIKVWKKAGESSIVKLEVEGKSKNVLIYNVDEDPLTGTPRHVDFYAADMAKKISANIPLEFIGEAPAVKTGGVLVKVMHEVEVEALPADLPNHLEVDLSQLQTFEDKILVKDMKMPDEVSMLSGPEEVIAFAEEAREEIVPETPASIEDIKVVGKEKKEEAVEDEEKKKEENA